jgi:hypothetical protein
MNFRRFKKGIADGKKHEGVTPRIKRRNDYSDLGGRPQNEADIFFCRQMVCLWDYTEFR